MCYYLAKNTDMTLRHLVFNIIYYKFFPGESLLPKYAILTLIVNAIKCKLLIFHTEIQQIIVKVVANHFVFRSK